MGLLDVLNGMQNGPRGPSAPSPESQEPSSSGGMSPITMAILGLLAWKAFKHMTGGPAEATPQPSPKPAPLPTHPGGTVSAGPVGGSLGSSPGGGGFGGGGLGDLLKGGLGGLLAGGAAGSVLSGGLGDLLNQLQQGGHGETANSWVGKGQNKDIPPRDLANALGADQIESLSAQTGLSRDELLQGLSQYLPRVVDHLTPDGRLPTEKELSGRL